MDNVGAQVSIKPAEVGSGRESLLVTRRNLKKVHNLNEPMLSPHSGAPQTMRA